jgi:aspartyl-tRNA(Asn)/glutamyl-tRNA(Gln) amidotransferase subunit C
MFADNQAMSSLTIADVERIAALAHLELTDDEKLLFTRQLADILTYVEQLQGVDTTGVPATAHVNSTMEVRLKPDSTGEASGAERPDELRPPLSVEDALANAPDAAREAGLFRVPRVIG